MSFNKHSHFNPKGNFSEVKFGERLPVLQVELNELQQIQNDARETFIENTLGNGLIDSLLLNSVADGYMLKQDAICYIKGKKILIPKDTPINLVNAGDYVVFIEAWISEVNHLDKLNEYGGVKQPLIPNNIKDFDIETTRRLVVKWRLRCDKSTDVSSCKVQGDLATPTTSTFNTSDRGVHIGNNAECSFKGIVYALPLLKIKKSSSGNACTHTYISLLSNTEITKQLSEKIELIVANELPPLPNRKKGTMYYKITDTQSGGGGSLPSEIRVSPNMGIQIK